MNSAIFKNRSSKGIGLFTNSKLRPFSIILVVAFLFVVFIGKGSPLCAAEGSGLQTSVAVDIVADTALGENSAASDKAIVRGAEVMFYGPIDHLFDGYLSLAAHPEGGASLFEVHEAYIASSKLLPRSRFRFGQFFLGIGRLNQIHQHDWPFISAPAIHKEVFQNEEGALDSGFEYSLLLPVPFYLDLSLGATNGFTYGHSHDAGEKPKQPNFYAHLKSFFDVGEFGIQPAFSYLERKDAEETKTQLLGFNLTAKKREGKVLKFLLESELWQKIEKQTEAAEATKIFGAYIYPQYGFNSQYSFGLRTDYFSVQSLKTFSQKKADNHRIALVPTFAFKASEFSTVRLAYTWEEHKKNPESTSYNRLVELQTTFIIGAHPAHEF
ncbi:MAG: hypothetical protein KBD78_11865 [Oligoflexales bacterium]|nr:hypothetical protein [Oligoflexales bacterium]